MIKKLAGCVREYWLVSLLAPITVVGEVILEVIIPKLMADLIDFGINKGDMSYIWLTGAKLVTACLISLLCGALAGMFAAKAAAGSTFPGRLGPATGRRPIRPAGRRRAFGIRKRRCSRHGNRNATASRTASASRFRHTARRSSVSARNKGTNTRPHAAFIHAGDRM